MSHDAEPRRMPGGSDSDDAPISPALVRYILRQQDATLGKLDVKIEHLDDQMREAKDERVALRHEMANVRRDVRLVLELVGGPGTSPPRQQGGGKSGAPEGGGLLPIDLPSRALQIVMVVLLILAGVLGVRVAGVP